MCDLSAIYVASDFPHEHFHYSYFTCNYSYHKMMERNVETVFKVKKRIKARHSYVMSVNVQYLYVFGSKKKSYINTYIYIIYKVFLVNSYIPQYYSLNYV